MISQPGEILRREIYNLFFLFHVYINSHISELWNVRFHRAILTIFNSFCKLFIFPVGAILRPIGSFLSLTRTRSRILIIRLLIGSESFLPLFVLDILPASLTGLSLLGLRRGKEWSFSLPLRFFTSLLNIGSSHKSCLIASLAHVSAFPFSRNCRNDLFHFEFIYL